MSATLPEQLAKIPTVHAVAWDAVLKPKGFQNFAATSLAAAVGLTPPDGARVALIQCEGQDVRWRDDGTNPTASIGMRLYAGGDGVWYTGDLTAVKFIEVGASATMQVSYYGSALYNA